MSDLDHAAEARRILNESEYLDPRNGVVASVVAAEAQVHATLALVEQQRIANLIALAEHAHMRFGNYAGEAGDMGTLFLYGETPAGSVRLRDPIKRGLGL